MSATVVLDQQQRNGTVDSGSVAVPTNADGTLANNPATGQPYQFFLITPTMSDADALDASKSCRLQVRISWDGVTYVSYGDTLPWVGGTRDRSGNPRGPSTNPSIPLDNTTGLPPQRVMIRLDTAGNQLNTGFTVDFR